MPLEISGEPEPSPEKREKTKVLVSANSGNFPGNLRAVENGWVATTQKKSEMSNERNDTCARPGFLLRKGVRW